MRFTQYCIVFLLFNHLFTSVSGKNLAVPAVVESLVEAYQLVQADEMEEEQSVVW